MTLGKGEALMDATKTRYLRSVVKTWQAGGFNPLDVRHHCMKVGMAERKATLFAVRLSRMPCRQAVAQSAMQE